MASFKYTEIPPFSKREEDALLFDQDGYLEYYIPEDYFGHTSATIEGAYVKLLGSFNYRIYDKNDSPGKLMTFNFPTIFMCKPSRIEIKKDLKLDETLDPYDYRILVFERGDQLVTRCHVEKDIDNMSELFRLHIQTGKVPNTIPYNTLYEYPFECMALNSGAYAVHSQAMGLLYSKICRDPDDNSIPFRMGKTIDKSMTGYTPISIKEAAKNVSPFVSITSENFDESVMSAILLTEDEKNGTIKHRESPLERVLTM